MSKVVNGTTYKDETPDELVALLEKLRLSQRIVHISYGYTHEGQGGLSEFPIGLDWLEEYETFGRIGRSTSAVKIPLLVEDGEDGGGGILDDCIVRVRSANGKVLYQHPQYHHGYVEIRKKPRPVECDDLSMLTVDVFRDNKPRASFHNINEAREYCRKMGLEVSKEVLQ